MKYQTLLPPKIEAFVEIIEKMSLVIVLYIFPFIVFILNLP